MTRFSIMSLVTILSVVFSASLASAQQGSSATEHDLKITDVLLVLFTAILAAGTLALWVVSIFQTKDVKESLKLAIGQLEFANAQRAKNLTDQLFEFDKLLIAHPELQIQIEKLRSSEKPLQAAAKDADFVKVKAFLYMHLNFFDEIISTYKKRPKESATVEYDDWAAYIVEKLKHPAYKEIMLSEPAIFGEQLRTFVADNKEKIDSTTGVPWVF